MGVMFAVNPEGFVRDWHPAPQRQFVITLAGEAEVVAGDGETRRLRPGTVLLVEDTTGRGHVTRGVGAGEWRSLWVPLAGLAGRPARAGGPPPAAATYQRIYAGPDDESHFEEVAVELMPVAGAAARSALIPATGLVFRRTPPGHHLDWHTAPRQQFVITLAGEVEIVASDGVVRRFGPGAIVLADDTTGRGHVSRAVGAGERLSVFVPLA